MTRIAHHMVTMTRGEVTPLAQARIDLQDYTLGMKSVQNFMPMKYGGLTRVPGTFDLNACEDETAASRLMTFVFSQNQAYALEFSNLVIRFHTVDGVVGGGTPVEVVSPYLQADLWNIQIETIGDVIYITCDGYDTKTLTRNSETSWTLADFTPTRGPWLPVVSGGASLKPANTGHAIPAMTGLTAPSGTVTSSDSLTDAWEMFDRDKDTLVNLTDQITGWIAYDYGSGTEKTIVAYMLRCVTPTDYDEGMPISWTIEGQEDGSSDWVILDVQTNTSDWVAGEVRIFELSNATAYRKYRIQWNDSAGATSIGTAGAVMGNWEPLLSPDEQTAFNLTATSVTGINGDTGFQTGDVGRQIKAMAEDGYWRYLEIIARTSTTVVTVKVLGPAPIPNDQQNFGAWALQAWGDEEGWPATVTRHKGRLSFFRSTTALRTGWVSVSADYDNFGTSQPLLDDDAITFTLANGDQDDILWSTTNDEDLLLGTVGGIRIIAPRDRSAVFGPSNHEESGSTHIRAGAVLPVWVGNILLFGNKQRSKVFETAFSLDEGGYVARELTMLAEHIFRGKIKELHYQPEPMNTLWVVLDDGVLAACTYDRQQQVFGVGRVVVPGTSAEVVSMCILPDDEYDVPMLVTKRTVDSAAQYRIEKMADMYRAEHGSNYAYPVYLMSAATYSGAAASTITGLGHLEGESVEVYDITTGESLGAATVSSSQITVPGGGTVTHALVGLKYTSSCRTLNPPNRSEDGHFMNRPMRVVKIHADLFETYGLYGGGDNHTHLLQSEADHANEPDAPALHTGMLEVPAEEGWAVDQSALFTTDSVFPATIRALSVELDRGS